MALSVASEEVRVVRVPWWYNLDMQGLTAPFHLLPGLAQGGGQHVRARRMRAGTDSSP